jgi:hypothetical protein
MSKCWVKFQFCKRRQLAQRIPAGLNNMFYPVTQENFSLWFPQWFAGTLRCAENPVERAKVSTLRSVSTTGSWKHHLPWCPQNWVWGWCYFRSIQLCVCVWQWHKRNHKEPTPFAFWRCCIVLDAQKLFETLIFLGFHNGTLQILVEIVGSGCWLLPWMFLAFEAPLCSAPGCKFIVGFLITKQKPLVCDNSLQIYR